MKSGHPYIWARYCEPIIPIFCVLVVDGMNGFCVVLTTCSLLEFVMAQTPNRMRGIMLQLGMVIAVGGFNVLGNSLPTAILHHFQTATPSCVFYYYLVLSLLMLLIQVRLFLANATS